MRKFLLALLDSPFSNEQEQRATLEKCLVKVYESDAKREKALSVLKTVMDCKWASDGGPAGRDRDQSNLNGDKTVRDVLRPILAQRVTAMVIENAQYCDELSWNELLFVMDMPVTVSILLTVCSLQSSQIVSTRNTTGMLLRSSLQAQKSFDGLMRSTDFLHSVSSRQNCIVVDLPPLSENDVSRILTHVLQTKVDESIVKLVHDSSSGNPFWCHMIASYIKDSGLKGFTEAYKNNSTRSPFHVVFICRFEKLSSDHQVVVRYASVIGNKFSLATLHSILPPRFQVNLNKCLEVLSEYGFILCLSQSPPMYAFQNILVRRFLYDLTPFRCVGATYLISRLIKLFVLVVVM